MLGLPEFDTGGCLKDNAMAGPGLIRRICVSGIILILYQFESEEVTDSSENFNRVQ